MTISPIPPSSRSISSGAAEDIITMRAFAVCVTIFLILCGGLSTAVGAERAGIIAYHARISAEARVLHDQAGYFAKDPFVSNRTLPNWAQVTVFFRINSTGQLIRGPEFVTLGNKNAGRIVTRELSAALKKTASIKWQLPANVAKRTMSMSMLACSHPQVPCGKKSKSTDCNPSLVKIMISERFRESLTEEAVAEVCRKLDAVSRLGNAPIGPLG